MGILFLFYSFILNHAVHVEALKEPSQVLENDDVRDMISLDINNVTFHDAKLTLKTPKGKE